jgi:hypothetical protein
MTAIIVLRISGRQQLLCCVFQDDSNFRAAYYDSSYCAAYFRMTAVIVLRISG